MKNLTFGLVIRNPGSGRVLAVLLAALFVVALASAGCMDDSASSEESSSDAPEAPAAAASGQSVAAQSPPSQPSPVKGEGATSAASGQAAASSSSASAPSQSAGADSVVSAVNQNPSGAGPELDYSRNAALRNATPLDAVTWTTPPIVGGGELSGAGQIAQGTDLFEPMIGDGAAFAVYYPGHDDPMVALLPDLGPMEMWNTNHTVADMEWEREATSFTFRAYSPLFMDAGDELELHVFGYDADGNDALLAVTKIGAGQSQASAGGALNPPLPPMPTPVAAAGQSGASSGSSGGASGGSSQPSSEDSTVSAVNQNPSGAGPMLEYGQNDALRHATPIDAVNWTSPPTVGAGALEGAGEFTQDVNPFDPTLGEGAALAVYFSGHDDPLVVLLPELPPTQMWNTDHTVAEMEWELDWPSFTFTAYSPLFMDMGGDLELLVFGYDKDLQRSGSVGGGDWVVGDGYANPNGYWRLDPDTI